MNGIRERSIATCIILTFVTCGIYGLFWFVTLTDDVNIALGEGGTSGGMALVLTIVTCGIYGFFWAYTMGDKIDKIKTRQGRPAGNGGLLYVILYFFVGIIAYALIQHELNQAIAYEQGK